MTAIAAEIERFNRLSATWWDSRGHMRPLHVVNALRLDFVVEQIASHLNRDRSKALNGLRILDVGCGGGLMSEALARFGANVVGVDASPGKYIQRMGGPCKGCRYDPALREGERACPYTTLYWDFLMRHETLLAKNPRMALQVKNVVRMTGRQKQAVTLRADAIRRGEVGVAQ